MSKSFVIALLCLTLCAGIATVSGERGWGRSASLGTAAHQRSRRTAMQQPSQPTAQGVVPGGVHCCPAGRASPPRSPCCVQAKKGDDDNDSSPSPGKVPLGFNSSAVSPSPPDDKGGLRPRSPSPPKSDDDDWCVTSSPQRGRLYGGHLQSADQDPEELSSLHTAGRHRRPSTARLRASTRPPRPMTSASPHRRRPAPCTGRPTRALRPRASRATAGPAWRSSTRPAATAPSPAR